MNGKRLNDHLIAIRRLDPSMQRRVEEDVREQYLTWHRAWPNPTFRDWCKKAWLYYVLPNQMWRLPWR